MKMEFTDIKDPTKILKESMEMEIVKTASNYSDNYDEQLQLIEVLCKSLEVSNITEFYEHLQYKISQIQNKVCGVEYLHNAKEMQLAKNGNIRGKCDSLLHLLHSLKEILTSLNDIYDYDENARRLDITTMFDRCVATKFPSVFSNRSNELNGGDVSKQGVNGCLQDTLLCICNQKNDSMNVCQCHLHTTGGVCCKGHNADKVMHPHPRTRNTEYSVCICDNKLICASNDSHKAANCKPVCQCSNIQTNDSNNQVIIEQTQVLDLSVQGTVEDCELTRIKKDHQYATCDITHSVQWASKSPLSCVNHEAKSPFCKTSPISCACFMHSDELNSVKCSNHAMGHSVQPEISHCGNIRNSTKFPFSDIKDRNKYTTTNHSNLTQTATNSNFSNNECHGNDQNFKTFGPCDIVKHNSKSEMQVSEMATICQRHKDFGIANDCDHIAHPCMDITDNNGIKDTGNDIIFTNRNGNTGGNGLNETTESINVIHKDLHNENIKSITEGEDINIHLVKSASTVTQKHSSISEIHGIIPEPLIDDDKSDILTHENSMSWTDNESKITKIKTACSKIGKAYPDSYKDKNKKDKIVRQMRMSDITDKTAGSVQVLDESINIKSGDNTNPSVNNTFCGDDVDLDNVEISVVTGDKENHYVKPVIENQLDGGAFKTSVSGTQFSNEANHIYNTLSVSGTQCSNETMSRYNTFNSFSETSSVSGTQCSNEHNNIYNTLYCSDTQPHISTQSSNDTSSVIDTIGNHSKSISSDYKSISNIDSVGTQIASINQPANDTQNTRNRLSVNINHLQVGTQVNGCIQSISSTDTVSGVNTNDIQSLNGTQSSINNSSLSGTEPLVIQSDCTSKYFNGNPSVSASEFTRGTTINSSTACFNVNQSLAHSQLQTSNHPINGTQSQIYSKSHACSPSSVGVQSISSTKLVPLSASDNTPESGISKGHSLSGIGTKISKNQLLNGESITRYFLSDNAKLKLNNKAIKANRHNGFKEMVKTMQKRASMEKHMNASPKTMLYQKSGAITSLKKYNDSYFFRRQDSTFMMDKFQQAILSKKEYKPMKSKNNYQSNVTSHRIQQGYTTANHSIQNKGPEYSYFNLGSIDLTNDNQNNVKSGNRYFDKCYMSSQVNKYIGKPYQQMYSYNKPIFRETSQLCTSNEYASSQQNYASYVEANTVDTKSCDRMHNFSFSDLNQQSPEIIQHTNYNPFLRESSQSMLPKSNLNYIRNSKKRKNLSSGSVSNTHETISHSTSGHLAAPPPLIPIQYMLPSKKRKESRDCELEMKLNREKILHPFTGNHSDLSLRCSILGNSNQESIMVPEQQHIYAMTHYSEPLTRQILSPVPDMPPKHHHHSTSTSFYINSQISRSLGPTGQEH